MSKSEQDAVLDECFTYDRKLLNARHMLEDGVTLQTSRTAKTQRWQNGAVVVTDGPFVESNATEQVQAAPSAGGSGNTGAAQTGEQTRTAAKAVEAAEAAAASSARRKRLV